MEKVGMKVVLCISLIFILSTAVKNCDRKEEIDAWFISLSPEEAKQMIESNQNIVVFDIRTVDEYNAEHIKEAIPMPLSKFLCKSYLQSILDSYRDKEIILYSNNGTLSKKVFDILQRNGFQFVYSINGGLDAWKNANFSLITKEHSCDSKDYSINGKDITLQEVERAIEQKNANWTAGYTSVSNLSYEEKIAMLGDMDMYIPNGDVKEISYNGKLPEFFDWRNVNGTDWTTPIKNQGSLGTCWAFATVACVETVIHIFDGYPWGCDLSEAHLIWCSTGNKNFYLKQYGLPDETCFPYYRGVAGQECNTCPDWEKRARKIAKYGTVPNDVFSIQKALVKYGPLFTTMDVYSDFYFYNGGIYSHTSGGIVSSHAVAIVGYNNKSKYWICKNSWGTDWGENGWFRIKYGNCNIGRNTCWYSANHDPMEPCNPTPCDGARNVDISTMLSWTGGDPDNDTVYYDVYFKKGWPLTMDDIVSYHQTNTTYNPGILEKDTIYYWRIVATDIHGDSTIGPIWHFWTEDTSSPMIEIVKPQQGYMYKDGGRTIKQIPFPWAAVVIGNITVEVDAWDNNSGVNRVEIYVDDTLKITLNKKPYKWLWEENKSGRYKVKIIVYDNAENFAVSEIKVWVFNF